MSRFVELAGDLSQILILGGVLGAEHDSASVFVSSLDAVLPLHSLQIFFVNVVRLKNGLDAAVMLERQMPVATSERSDQAIRPHWSLLVRRDVHVRRVALEESAVRGLISHSIRKSLLQAILAVRGLALVTSADDSAVGLEDGKERILFRQISHHFEQIDLEFWFLFAALWLQKWHVEDFPCWKLASRKRANPRH